ncbi:ribosome-binding ATPase YchF [Capsulimonas corticalis]|uniref:Ribosome-binding ATPase YchF n=1 Tax=Capsulimonas corticalis TaxID=2219043 RepID=A0A402D602_9BACT|nr:redox-regulated ATPase YchF [Capsulimonas corticalis]BDI32505.1 ribosome-binding ATPase YchF [Capsulimonas corticalis]
MGFKCGIVGLPNVGKSTLFNALLSTAQAEAANYPFCTIEPNVGRVGVPDERLEKLAAIVNSETIIPTQLEFVDIAGLVRGASKGEGLGNKFLSHIREVDAIVYVLRCFEDGNIIHVENSIDPMRDADIVETELTLADLESLEKRLPALQKRAKTEKELAEQVAVMERVLKVVAEGHPARTTEINDASERRHLEMMQLLTSKPVMYVCNVDEDSAATGNALSAKVAEMAKLKNAPCVVISARIEAEISSLPSAEDKADFLSSLGLEETGLAQIIKAGYRLLDLVTYFTAGPKETRAWTIVKGMQGPAAAGVIHTDFEKGFIRAETIAYDDFIAYNGEQGAKEAGKFRLEGKEYVVQDGDVLHFRFKA